jgi:hypothetical protein
MQIYEIYTLFSFMLLLYAAPIITDYVIKKYWNTIGIVHSQFRTESTLLE